MLAEGPRLWQVYLARGAANLHTVQYKEALDDRKRAERQLRLYDSYSKALAFITAVQAYALCRRQNTRDGDKLFVEAKKRGPRS